jgi:hypothetical protein
MFRTTLALAYVKRTFRPLYAFSQATPQGAFLDTAWNRSVAIFPGMVATRTTGNNHTLIGSGGATTNDVASGFFANFIGGNGIDELLDAGINALGVWVLSPDAEFEVLAPAFDVTGGSGSAGWAQSSGADTLVYASVSGSNQGQLVASDCSTKSTKPVARLVQIESPTSIIISGLTTRTV